MNKKLYALLLSVFLFAVAHAQEVVKKDGKIILRNGSNQTVVSTNNADAFPVANKSNVFFVKKNTSGADKIISYDISKGTSTEIVSEGMTAKGYTVKGPIVNMLLDNNSNMLVFSNKDTYPSSDRPLYLTWRYDLNTNQLSIFKDGRVAIIDNSGNIETHIDDVDEKGHFIQKLLFSPQGKILNRSEKEYK